MAHLSSREEDYSPGLVEISALLRQKLESLRLRAGPLQKEDGEEDYLVFSVARVWFEVLKLEEMRNSY